MADPTNIPTIGPGAGSPSATPNPGDPNYSLVTDPNYHPELANDISGQTIEVSTPNGNIQVPAAQWISMTNAEQYALQHGLPQYDTAFKGDMGLVKTDKGEYVTKFDMVRLAPEDQQYLLRNGLDAFNQFKKDQLAAAAADLEKNTVLLDNGERVDRTFYNNLPTKIDDFVSEYDNPQQLLKTKGIDAFNAWAQKYEKDLAFNYAARIGANLETYNKIPTPEGQAAYIKMVEAANIANTGLDIIATARFQRDNVQVGPKENNEWMPKTDFDGLLANLQQVVLNSGYAGLDQKFKDYENALSPYFIGESPTRAPADENYYDLSKITLEDAKNPAIREAVSSMFPSYDVNQLGKQPIDRALYERLQREHLPNAKISGISARDIDKYYPIEALSITDYQARKNDLLNSGLSQDEVNKTMGNYYMVTGDAKEFQEYAKNQQLDVTYKPSTWQQMTPWREELGHTVTLVGGATLAADILCPGFYVARKWSDLSNGERAFNIVLDAITVLPIVGTAGMAARTVETSSRIARVAAVSRALSQEIVGQLTAPIKMVIHPIATARGTYRTLADLLTDMSDPKKVPGVTITTSDGVVRLGAEQAKTPKLAMAFRDKLTELSQAGKKPVVEIIDKNGNGYRVELAVSPLMSASGGGLAHASPDLAPFLEEITTTTRVDTQSVLSAYKDARTTYEAKGIAAKISGGKTLTAAEQKAANEFALIENGLKRLAPDQAATLPREEFELWAQARKASNHVEKLTTEAINKLKQLHTALLYRKEYKAAEELRGLIKNVDIDVANRMEAEASKFEIRSGGKVVLKKEGMPEDEQGWFLSTEPAPDFAGSSAFGKGVVPTPGIVKEGKVVSKAKVSRHMEAIKEYRPADITRLDKKPIRKLNLADVESIPPEVAPKIEAYFRLKKGRIYGSFGEYLKINKAKRAKDLDAVFDNQDEAINDLRNIFEQSGYETRRVKHGFEYRSKPQSIKRSSVVVKPSSYNSIEGLLSKLPPTKDGYIRVIHSSNNTGDLIKQGGLNFYNGLDNTVIPIKNNNLTKDLISKINVYANGKNKVTSIFDISESDWNKFTGKTVLSPAEKSAMGKKAWADFEVAEKRGATFDDIYNAVEEGKTWGDIEREFIAGTVSPDMLVGQARKVGNGIEYKPKVFSSKDRIVVGHDDWIDFGDISDRVFHANYGIGGMSRPGNIIDGIEVETLGEQYLRQVYGAVSGDAKSAIRTQRVRKAAKDIRKIIEASGAEKRKPGIYILSPKTAAKAGPSNKLYWTENLNTVIDEINGVKVGKSAAEMERVLPPGEPIPSPKQFLYTRYGPNKQILVIGLEEPLSQANIELIRNKKLIETIKLPFKRPISVTKLGKGLASEGIEELAQILRKTNNRIAARNLEQMVADATSVRSLELGAKGAVNSIFSLSRYDPRTGEVISDRVQRVSSGRAPSASRAPAREGAAQRATRVSSGRAPSASRASAREGAAQRATRVSSGRAPSASRAPMRMAERTSPTRGRTTPEAPRTPVKRVNPPRTKTTTRHDSYKPRDRGYRGKGSEQHLNINLPDDGKSKQDDIDLSASVAWNQGKLKQHGRLVDQYIVIHPPYGRSDKFYTDRVPEGVPIVDGPQSAYDTIRKITKGKLPAEFGIDMGMMDVKITSIKEVPKLKFLPDPDLVKRHAGHIKVLPRRASPQRVITSR